MCTVKITQKPYSAFDKLQSMCFLVELYKNDEICCRGSNNLWMERNYYNYRD